MSAMHVAINGWFWDRPDTGSGQYTRELIRAMRAIRPELAITLVLPPHIAPDQGVPPGVTLLPTHLPLGGDPGKVWFEQATFPRAAARAGADLCHVPYWGPPLASPRPVVATIHDVIALSMPVYQGGFLARLYTSLVAAAARGLAHVITDSQASAAEIESRLAISRDRITSIGLAAEERFHPRLGAERDAAVRAHYNLPERFVLYLGGFDIRKNVQTLLLAYTYVSQALADEVPLVLAGRPPRQWGSPRFPDLPAYVRQLDLDDRVLWLGEIQERDKPSLYRLAEVSVFPSRYEGFGLPVLEAMACGTPVVACAASSIPEVAGEAAFLVDPNDARGMGGAILGLLVQPPLADQLRNLGLARASQFGWRKTAEETLAVYEQALRAS